MAVILAAVFLLLVWNVSLRQEVLLLVGIGMGVPLNMGILPLFALGSFLGSAHLNA